MPTKPEDIEEIEVEDDEDEEDNDLLGEVEDEEDDVSGIIDPGIAKDEALIRPGATRPAAWYGAIAQLGERLHGMQEVSGSIPLGSTNSA